MALVGSPDAGVSTDATGRGLVAVAPGCPLIAPPRTPGSVCAQTAEDMSEIPTQTDIEDHLIVML
jgi:hypothetical protein